MGKEKIKILLAEDDIQLIDMYEKKFELEGFEVVVAEDGEKTLKVINEEKNKLDVILLDIMMPNLNGIEVLKRVRENPETKDIMIIILTNLDNESTIEEVYRYGVTEFMVKAELTPMQVVDKVKELLRIYKKIKS